MGLYPTFNHARRIRTDLDPVDRHVLVKIGRQIKAAHSVLSVAAAPCLNRCIHRCQGLSCQSACLDEVIGLGDFIFGTALCLYGHLCRAMGRQGWSARAPLKQAALTEYAGEHSKLLSLLATEDRAARNSAVVKRLLSSGELFHPLAWSTAEAFAFFKDIPVCETAGAVRKCGSQGPTVKIPYFKISSNFSTRAIPPWLKLILMWPVKLLSCRLLRCSMSSSRRSALSVSSGGGFLRPEPSLLFGCIILVDFVRLSEETSMAPHIASD
jgi:hypothetical protein